MQLIDYMKSIINKEPLKYSVLFGEEQKIIDVYIEKICELGYIPVYVDSVANAVKESKKGSFIKENKLFIVSNDDEFLKHESKWNLLKELNTNNLIV